MNSYILRDRLIGIIENPRSKKECELLNSLKVIGPRAVEYILRNLDSISTEQISEYGCMNFEKLDFRPNPTDKLVSSHEILESLEVSKDLNEQTILVAIWLRFEEIRVCHKDFEGAEAAFDTQLSYKDFFKFGKV